MRRLAVALAAALAAALAGDRALSVCAQAHAQARSDEQSMFGAPAAPSTPAAPPGEGSPPAAPPAATNQPSVPAPVPVAAPAPTVGGGSDRDRFVLGDPSAATKVGADAAPDNPLTIGGQLYLRAQSGLPWHGDPDTWTLAAPSLIDVFFDARPNDRVRAYLLGRVSYDPTAAPGAVMATPATTGVPVASTGFTSFNAARGPAALLDQMWIAFDIERRVFVTAGKQHVKWGTGHIWTPTDYLHPTKRNPLDVFDVRGGVTMLRLQVPFEDQAATLYGYAVFEDPINASNKVEQVAGAARAEFILLGAEIGLDVFAKKGQKARFGVDLSTGLGDFDVYADAAIRFGEDFYVVTADDPTPSRLSGVKTQLVSGISWSHKYNDNDLFTVGAEYFYNQPGYTGSGIYPTLLAQAVMHQDLPLANFFYLGRHYAAVSLSLPAPYSWNYTTFTLSTLGNLSDRSYVSRLDYSVTVLTHLTFQAFAALHFGQEGGELRFQYVTNGLTVVPTPFIDLGVALRLKF